MDFTNHWNRFVKYKTNKEMKIQLRALRMKFRHFSASPIVKQLRYGYSLSKNAKFAL